MAKITIHLPDNVAQRARETAQRANKSLSAFVEELLTQATGPRRWSPEFAELLRTGSAELIDSPDLPPERVAQPDWAGVRDRKRATKSTLSRDAILGARDKDRR